MVNGLLFEVWLVPYRELKPDSADLQSVPTSNPNADLDDCYSFVSNLISDVRVWVINNPNSHLNDLVLPDSADLQSVPTSNPDSADLFATNKPDSADLQTQSLLNWHKFLRIYNMNI